MAFGTRMEAATEALLRVRDEVVATLDRQVTELQQIHRALAYAPPPMIVTEDCPRPLNGGAAPVPVVGSSLFEQAPRQPNTRPAPATTVAQSTPCAVTPAQQHAAVAVATMDEIGVPFQETTLDPMLERATLEELNNALASAFAMVSSRSSR